MAEVISKDGTRISYEKTGDGPPLILVGGAMIHKNFGPFVELAKHMSKQFTVINYDRRGRFESSDTLPYSPEREVEDLSALLQVVGGRANIYGISSGAALVVLAAAAGLPFTKIALYEPPYVGWDEKKLGRLDEFLSRLDSLLSQNKRGAVVKSFLALVGVPALIRWIMPLFPFWKQAISMAHTIPYDLKILGNQEVPVDLLARVHTPTLVMAGELSQARLREAAQKLAKAMNTARYEELKGQRHDVSPEAQARVLNEFFLEAR